MKDRKEFKEYMDDMLESINELDSFSYFNIHRTSSKNSHFYLRGFKDGNRFDYDIPLNYFKGLNDRYNPKLFPLFRKSDGDIDDNKEQFSEIITDEKYIQENITYSKFNRLKQRMYADGELPFSTSFLNTKPAHLMFQTNILKKDLDIKKVNTKIMNMCFFDIETSAGFVKEENKKVGSPFRDMAEQKNKLRTIVTYSTKNDKFYVFSYKKFNLEKIKSMITENVYYDDGVKQNVKDRFDSIRNKIEVIDCEDERTLLAKFIKHVRKDYDMLIGWNSNSFDLPFIVSRIKSQLGEKYVQMLSPFGKVSLKEVEKDNSWKVDIAGLPHIDMLEMYKVFNFDPKMSYSLSNIMQEEAGIDKIEHELDDYDEFYDKDFDNYILYNIQDVNGLAEINIATDFIQMAALQAAESKINIADTYSKTTLHTFAMIDKLRKEKKVYANDKLNRESFNYEGGYVEANLGVYRLLKSRDFTSLYPTNIIEFNMSAETIFFKEDYARMVREIGKENIITTLDPDVFFRKDKIGVMASYALDNFKLRKHYKKLRDQYPKGSLEYIQYDSFQHNQKIKINSLYGANGADFWYFSNYHIASLTTQTARHLIKLMKKVLIDVNTDTDLLAQTYNQDIYTLEFNDKNVKVYGNDILKVNRNNNLIDVAVNQLEESDEIIQLCA